MNKCSLLLASLIVTIPLHALTLKEGVDAVLQIDPEIKEYEARQKSLLYEKRKAKGNYYPSLNVQMGVNYNKEKYDTYDELYQKSTVLGISQNIFNSFADQNKIKLEGSRERSAYYRLLQKQNAITLEFVTNYLSLLKQQDLLTIAHMSFDYHQVMYEKIKGKVQKGVGRQLEINHLQTSTDLARLTLQVEQRNLKLEEIRFSRLMQQQVKSKDLDSSKLEVCLDSASETYMDKAMEAHPSVMVAKKNQQVAEHEYAYSKRYYYPTLDLSANYNFAEAIKTERQMDSYNINLKLKYNLFNGFKDRNEEHKQVERLKQNSYLFKSSERDVKNRLMLAWESYQADKNNYEIVLLNVRSKKETLNSYKYEFLLGRASLNAMLDATESYYNALRKMTQSYYQLLIEQYQILEATGVLVEYFTDADTKVCGDDKAKLTYSLEQKNEVVTSSAKKFKNELQCFEVLSNKLNIRKEPDIKSQLTGFVLSGTTICSQEVTKDWIKIEKGWVFKSLTRPIIFAKKKKNDTEKNSFDDNSTAESREKAMELRLQNASQQLCYRVKSGILNIRAKPDRQAEIVETLNQNDRFCTQPPKGDWVAYKNGWAETQNLEPMKPEKGEDK